MQRESYSSVPPIYNINIIIFDLLFKSFGSKVTSYYYKDEYITFYQNLLRTFVGHEARSYVYVRVWFKYKPEFRNCIV